MKSRTVLNALIVLVVVVAVVAVACIKNRDREAPTVEAGTPAPDSTAQTADSDHKTSPTSEDESPAPTTQAAATPSTATTRPAAKLPRVVDLGATDCVACKKLAPILEELEKEYAGRATVEFIDVRRNPDAAEPYKIRLIPTQIFYDTQGQEIWRHEGFLSKEEFVAKLKEAGVQ